MSRSKVGKCTTNSLALQAGLHVLAAHNRHSFASVEDLDFVAVDEDWAACSASSGKCVCRFHAVPPLSQSLQRWLPSAYIRSCLFLPVTPETRLKHRRPEDICCGAGPCGPNASEQ